MNSEQLHWINHELPHIVGSQARADTAVEHALRAFMDAPKLALRREQAFWLTLGWDVAHNLQELWALGTISLQEATFRSQQLPLTGLEGLGCQQHCSGIQPQQSAQNHK